MGKILSIETSTSVCSVALHEKGELICLQEIHQERSHARFLTHLIDQVCMIAEIPLSALDAIAVSKGPGSYTGLRIEVSTAKGLCFSLEKPLITINTLEAMAHGMNQYNPGKALLVPMLDARRMEVYTTIMDANGNCVLPTQAHIFSESSFEEWKEPMLLGGNGAAKSKELFKNRSSIQYLENIHPSANYIGQLAYTSFQKDDFADLAYFEPFYLKDFVRLGKENK